MAAKHTRLRLTTASTECVLTKPGCNESKKIGLDDDALTAMTDFEHVSPITVRDIIPIDQALEYMIYSGVRSLFVLNRESRVLGLVTSYDIQGEKPIRYMQSVDCYHRDCSRADVLVKDIMEPVDELQDLEFDKVRQATVGDIVANFKRVGRKHLVVLDLSPGRRKATIRGMFSATQLERQLAMTIETTPTADSFADVERALIRGW